MGVWKSIYVTFNPGSNVVVHIGTNSSLLSSHTTDVAFPGTTISGITIGQGYDGLIQDFQIYTPSLETNGNQITVPPEAAFLSHCLCPSGYTLLADSCSNGSEIMDR